MAERSESGDREVREPEDESPLTLLSRLRAADPADISRPRKLKKNAAPTVGKKRSSVAGRCATYNPKSTSPLQRVREFSGENLTVSAGKLFCSGCREELGLKLSVIQLHVKSNKHRAGKERLQGSEAREQDIATAFARYSQHEHVSGETLSREVQVYRIQVVTTFLKAGIPLNKIDVFRDLLEKNGQRLAGRRSLSDLIPFIHQEEIALIKEELRGKKVSVIFDGTTRLGEAMAIILRFVDDWQIQQRLVRLRHLSKSLKGEEIARELISVLQIDYSISSDDLLGAMRDRASVNGLAMQTVKIMYPKILDVGCFAHTIDLVGQKFHTPNLDEFLSAWITLFSHSPKARLTWRTQTGIAAKSHSKTRWWSRWEVIDQLLKMFRDIQPFLEGNADIGPASRSKMLAILQDSQKKTYLMIEMAIVVDAGRYFVQATYNLEGDGPLVLKCYEQLEAVVQSIRIKHFPNTDAVINQLFSGQPVHITQQWRAYAESCVQNGFDYFCDRFGGILSSTVAAFKAARLFLPQKIRSLQPDASVVDTLRLFPFLDDNTLVESMKLELPTYLAAATDVESDSDTDPGDPLLWWKQHSTELPNWANAFCQVILIQPSSAAAECAFSLLNSIFAANQESALADM